LRGAAKARQAATYPEKGQKGFKSNVSQLIDSRTESESSQLDRNAQRTAAVRAEAAGTNRAYIELADKLLEEEPEVFMQVQAGKKRLSQIRSERAIPRGSNSHKPTPAKPAVTPTASNSQRRFTERHIGYIDACVRAQSLRKFGVDAGAKLR
jgi:hypothetical protein